MWQVVGHNRALSLLQQSLQRGTLTHAHLLVGPPHVGKMTLALELAKALNCAAAEPPCGECASCRKIALGNHADVQTVGISTDSDPAEVRAKTEIGIGQIKEMQHKASLPPFEGSHKVFIIDGAEFMSVAAANCLLKTLEEPEDRIMFVLLAASDRTLPSTVISRCQRLDLAPLTPAEIAAELTDNRAVEPSKAELISRLCHGCLGWALTAIGEDSLLEQRRERLDRLLEIATADYEERFTYAAQLASQFGQHRESVLETLGLWQEWWRDLLLAKTGLSEAVANIDRLTEITSWAGEYSLAQIKELITGIRAVMEQLRQNANPRLVLEVLMLNIPRKEGRAAASLT